MANDVGQRSPPGDRPPDEVVRVTIRNGKERTEETSAVENQIGELREKKRAILLPLFSLLVVVVLIFGLYRFFRTMTMPEARDADVDEAIAYLKTNASSVLEVRQMLEHLKQSRGVLLRTYIDPDRKDSAEGHVCHLFPDCIVISSGIWDSSGDDSRAYRALAWFGEWQHTRDGGSHRDDDSTQEVFARVRQAFPEEHQTTRVNSLSHKVR